MIHAEISIYPMGTKTESVGFYIAKAVESIDRMPDIRYQINAMGTILESSSMDAICMAVKQMTEIVHNLGVGRVEVLVKIDSRLGRDVTMDEKVESVRKHMDVK